MSEVEREDPGRSAQPFYTERGTPIAVKPLVETLAQAGHAVDLPAYHQGADVSIPGVRLLRAGRPPLIGPVPIGISVAKLVCDPWLIAAMFRLLWRNDYDVVHAVEEAVFPAAAWCALSRVRLVYDMDFVARRPAYGEMVAAQTGRRAAGRRGPGAGDARRLQDLAVRCALEQPGGVWVLPDVPMGNPAAVARSTGCATSPARDGVVALYVGNLEKYQGIDLLLKGTALVPRSLPLKTVIIGGDEPSIAHYRRMAEELGSANACGSWARGPWRSCPAISSRRRSLSPLGRTRR